MIVDLATIAELALALIGFSALIAVFRGGSIQAWEPRRRLALWVIVTYGLAALYFALLPTVFRALGVSSWAAPTALLAAFHLLSLVVLLRHHFQLKAAGHISTNAGPWVLATLIGLGAVGVLVGGIAGSLSGPTDQIYRLGVIACLVEGTIGFIGVLRLDRPAA
jgi:hypothetical protein